MKSQKNIKKFSAMLLGIAMVIQAVPVSATPGVDQPGVAGIFIDPISDIILNPVELADMQANGLEIPVTGYVQYITQTAPPRYKLDQLYVRGYWWNGTGWVLDGIVINVSTVAGGPLENITIRTTLQGREFSDTKFSAATTPWKIYKTGVYQVYATAHFTGGAEPYDTEDFTVVAPVVTITVYPMAAPNIAEIILEAEGVNPQQSIGKGKNRQFIHLIQFAADHMGPQTLFNGVEKSIIVDDVEVCNPDYWDAVLDFLNNQIILYSLSIDPLIYSLDDYIADLTAEP